MTERRYSFGELLAKYSGDDAVGKLIAAMRADGLPEDEITRLLMDEVYQRGEEGPAS